MKKTDNKTPITRIQKQKRLVILEAALEVFSKNGFRGSTIDQIAKEAGISKPNILYYYASKQEMHKELIERLMEKWLAPLEEMNAKGDPIAEISAYIKRKLEMARDYPRQSRLFNNEILQGAPHIIDLLNGELKALVDEKAKVIANWMKQGRLTKTDPHHLIFSIWATTQHYADFDVQICAVLGKEEAIKNRFRKAEKHLYQLFVRSLEVG
ncbi:MAG: TetR family transcriptional regulator C-terminal domain-containing protein [Proteobacteria bacterium]|nr:TetR family transcriptional regulator C-terminal domain-containing protein [Pseudomonadota bacterium]